MGKNKGVARAEAGTGEDAGSKYVREGESFCQTPDARCNGEKLANEREREQRDTLAFKHQRRHREARERAERDSITITTGGVTAGSEPAMERRASRRTRHRETAERRRSIP